MSADRHSIHLVRHGEAAAKWGQSADPGLSEKGQQQARATALELETALNHRQPMLVSSPLRRAQETAAALAERLGCNYEIDERFREIPSPVPLAQRQNWLRAFMRGQWSAQDEALHQWRASITEALGDLPPHAVVFTHFLVINTAVGHCERSDDTLLFWPENASVTTLVREADGLRVGTLGAQMKTVVN